MNIAMLPLLIQRMKTESPTLYKQLSRWAIIIGSLTGIIALISTEAPELLPKTAFALALIKLCKFIAASMVGVIATSKTTTLDPSLMTDDSKQVVLKEAVDKGVITATTTATVIISDEIKINDGSENVTTS